VDRHPAKIDRFAKGGAMKRLALTLSPCRAATRRTCSSPRMLKHAELVRTDSIAAAIELVRRECQCLRGEADDRARPPARRPGRPRGNRGGPVAGASMAAGSDVAKKLNLKPGMKARVVCKPADMSPSWGDRRGLRQGRSRVLVFVKTVAEVESRRRPGHRRGEGGSHRLDRVPQGGQARHRPQPRHPLAPHAG
jgi:hypothetical protein